MTDNPIPKLAISRQTSKEIICTANKTEEQVDSPEVTKFRVQVDDRTFLKSLASDWAKSGAQTELLSADDDCSDRHRGPFHCVHKHGQGPKPTLVAGTWQHGTVHWISRASMRSLQMAAASQPREDYSNQTTRTYTVMKQSPRLDTDGDVRGEYGTSYSTGPVVRDEDTTDGGYVSRGSSTTRYSPTRPMGARLVPSRIGGKRYKPKTYGATRRSQFPSEASAKRPEFGRPPKKQIKKKTTIPASDPQQHLEQTGVPDIGPDTNGETDLRGKGIIEAKIDQSTKLKTATKSGKIHKITITKQRLGDSYSLDEGVRKLEKKAYNYYKRLPKAGKNQTLSNSDNLSNEPHAEMSYEKGRRKSRRKMPSLRTCFSQGSSVSMNTQGGFKAVRSKDSSELSSPMDSTKTKQSTASSRTSKSGSGELLLLTGSGILRKTASVLTDEESTVTKDPSKSRLRRLPTRQAESEGIFSGSGASYIKPQVSVTTKSAGSETDQSVSFLSESGACNSLSNNGVKDVRSEHTLSSEHTNKSTFAREVSREWKKSQDQISNVSAENEQSKSTNNAMADTSCRCQLYRRDQVGWRHVQVRAWWVILLLLILAVLHTKLLFRTEEMIKIRHKRKWYEL
ncbi:uncharacterized protein LOC111254047 isoform X1 [Varroa destructor]|uniref:Uncharacterized protein n=1 Tax=Varroa destructor TaxID=109461 RepID=A0A7M7KSY6_VARDE|nr:uncharacterized protein LOC111254047 isoform X1 [Varroa destructor]